MYSLSGEQYYFILILINPIVDKLVVENDVWTHRSQHLHTWTEPIQLVENTKATQSFWKEWGGSLCSVDLGGMLPVEMHVQPFKSNINFQKIWITGFRIFNIL